MLINLKYTARNSFMSLSDNKKVIKVKRFSLLSQEKLVNVSKKNKNIQQKKYHKKIGPLALALSLAFFHCLNFAELCINVILKLE